MIKNLSVCIILFFSTLANAQPVALEEVISWGVENARKSTGWGLVGFRKNELIATKKDTSQEVSGWGVSDFKKTEPAPVIEQEPIELKILSSENMNEHEQYIKELAMSVGAQAGYHYELEKWTRRIQKHSKWLNQHFRFAPVLLKSGTLLPPVLTTSINNASLSGDARVIRTAGQVFKIVQPPKFVIVAPSWEDYLLSLSSARPTMPNSNELPTSAGESLVWEHFVINGWNQGIKKVEVDFSLNISRLRRDIVGMTLYHILFDRGMISEPTTVKSASSVAGDDDTLIIDDINLEITVLPKMQHNEQAWRVIGQLPELFGKGILE